MKKTLTRSNPFHPRPRFAGNSTRCALLGIGLLFSAACGDDSSPEVTSTATPENSNPADETATTPTQQDPETNDPETGTSDGETTGEVQDDSSSDDAALNADAGGPMAPPDGPAPGEGPERECGGERQACCEDEPPCNEGFACVPDMRRGADAGVDTELICKRDRAMAPPPGADGGMPVMPPAPEGDGGPPGPPGMPPAPEGDGGPMGPGMPPPPEGDGGPTAPPDMPPPPEGDGGLVGLPVPPDMANCGGEGEQRCAGPGGRCDDGLSCDNPNGPPLDDSECVPSE